MKRKSIYFFLLSFCFWGIQAVMGEVRLPKIFGNGMILQRDRPITIWGWADPGEAISVSLDKQTKSTTARSDGKWSLKLNAEKAGGPYELQVKGNNNITLTDVLLGDIWLCSGQSNMEFELERANNGKEEIAAANYPQIRQIKIPRIVAGNPQDDINGEVTWKTATPENVGKFTAVGYFFAKGLYKDLHVPIGLINSSWGGTMIETWISKEAFEQTSSFKDAITNFTEVPLNTLNKAQPNNYPTLLFNAMINPIIPFAIKGALWYQGETNASRGYQYREAFPLLINDWRKRWGQGDFPFYFVQLASYKAAGGTVEKGSSWAELRESQAKTLSLLHTGMAVITDIGLTNDIHPTNKQDVGKRLEAVALHDAYGKKVVYTGPTYKDIKVAGNQVTVSFNEVNGGLITKDGSVNVLGFAVAGDDQQFKPAKAKIAGDKVVVVSDSVSKPVAVRYSWADDAGTSNLYNKEGFPAGPFRTDNWPAFTKANLFSVKKP
ncbi:sialate O-acetylesterase [bacterium A37T11]|nr:sialate O-acetylesterase [bacterium A37T11]